MASVTDMAPDQLKHMFTEASQITAAKYYLIASITMMGYDMILTFHQEIISSLPLLILTPTGLLSCRRFVKFEGATTCASYAITNLIMILRVHALWQSKWVFGYLMSLCAIQVAMWGYVLANSEPVSYPSIDGLFHGCILTGKPQFGNKWQMWLFAYVIFDSSVFALVLAKTLRYSRETHSPLIKTLRNDGTAYFTVIFTVNVVWLVMTFKAAEPLKNINEHFSHLVSVVLISRLTIHLRSEGDRHNSQPWQPAQPLPSARGMRNHSNSLSGPPDPGMIASVGTYAGQRWTRSEKGKSRSSDSSTGGSPPESTTTTLRPSPEPTPADLDVEKAGEAPRTWRRGSLLRRDSIAPGGNALPEGERAERPVSWMTRMRSRRDTAATMFNGQTMPQPYVPETMATWDSAREAGPSPIEAAALSVRQSMDGYAFGSLQHPPPVRLAADYI